MHLALLALLLLILAVLFVRAANQDRRQYSRFKRLTSTGDRQEVYAQWLRRAFFTFGGLTGIVLLAASPFVPVAAADARAWPPFAGILSSLSGAIGAGLAVGALVVFLAVLVLPVVLFRKQVDEISTVGDVEALLPRNRRELAYGAGLAVNAGVLEELLFRLALPALIFGLTGSGIVSFLVAAAIFGALHLYQGLPGVIAATVLGLVFTVVYLISGSIVMVILLHVLVDLRSLVLIPLVVRRVWRISGSRNVEPAEGAEASNNAD